ncbi:MAG TPA: hypothetical protein VIO58_07410 [Candidatus Methanoperedens sp.]
MQSLETIEFARIPSANKRSHSISAGRPPERGGEQETRGVFIQDDVSVFLDYCNAGNISAPEKLIIQIKYNNLKIGRGNTKAILRAWINDKIYKEMRHDT